MDTKRRDFLKLMSAGATVPPAARRPNVVIIMADQQRADLTKRAGFPLDTMPALDGMAARGVAFDRAYTTAPLCVPARESLLTGRWPHAHRVRQNSAARFAYFTKDIFEVAKEAGYRTGLAGKNHSHLIAKRLDFWRPYSHLDGWLSNQPPREFVEFQNRMKHLNHGTAKEPSPFPVEAQFPHRIVSNAIEFVESTGTQPFALWVSFPEPHNPYQVPRPYFDMFPPDSVPARAVGPEVLKKKGFKWDWLRQLEDSTYPGYDKDWRRTRSNYLGMLRLIDDQVNRLMQHINLDNTIVVFLSDHGDFFCDYGLVRKGVELPEVLTRIPMVWLGAGIRPLADAPEFVSMADVMPTLCEAMGAPVPDGVQGRSLWPILKGDGYPREEFRSVYAEAGFGGLNYGPGDNIDANWGHIPGAPGAIPSFDELNPVTQSGNMKLVRMGDWKLSVDMMGNGQLYNLRNDPYELANLYGDPKSSAMRSELTTELLRWTIRTQDDLPTAAYKAKTAGRNWYAPYAPRER
jgi:arylsulfatase A-like enzyme